MVKIPTNNVFRAWLLLLTVKNGCHTGWWGHLTCCSVAEQRERDCAAHRIPRSPQIALVARAQDRKCAAEASHCALERACRASSDETALVGTRKRANQSSTAAAHNCAQRVAPQDFCQPGLEPATQKCKRTPHLYRSSSDKVTGQTYILIKLSGVVVCWVKIIYFPNIDSNSNTFLTHPWLLVCGIAWWLMTLKAILPSAGSLFQHIYPICYCRTKLCDKLRFQTWDVCKAWVALWATEHFCKGIAVQAFNRYRFLGLLFRHRVPSLHLCSTK